MRRTKHESSNQYASRYLQVYELLKTLNPALAEFSINNWQSTIQHYVKLHSEYRDIERWQGNEKADLVYDDGASGMTKLLIDHGYLDETGAERTPRYLLEVKSTTGPCEGRTFFHEQIYLQEGKLATCLKKGIRNSVKLITLHRSTHTMTARELYM